MSRPPSPPAPLIEPLEESNRLPPASSTGAWERLTERSPALSRPLGVAISDKQVTYDLARPMEDAHEISTSAFAQAMVERI